MTVPDSLPFAASFRDPGGALVDTGQRAIRLVRPEALADLDAFLFSETARDMLASGSLVSTASLPLEAADSFGGGQWGRVLEHERIPFPSYPYEWPPEMLFAAAALTLSLARKLQPEGLGLKDSSPYNVLFRGCAPVFIDVLSVERRSKRDPTWLPANQFIRTFLLPLLANRHFQIRLADVFLRSRDGLYPEQVYRLGGWPKRLRPGFFSLVTAPTWLGNRRSANAPGLYRPKPMDPEKAQFVLSAFLNSLHRNLQAVRPGVRRSSTWSEYANCTHYSAVGAGMKEAFVRDYLAENRPCQLLDVGANSGRFSKLAAEFGASVVAIDSDEAVIGELWRSASQRHLNILPLVVDISRPTPPTGWRNRESRSFLDRAAGRFDAVLLLAVIHHLLVTERIPLSGIAQLTGELTVRDLIVEYVGPDDPMFAQIVRGRESLHRDFSTAVFEAGFAPYFSVVSKARVPETNRWLYLMRKR